MKKKSRGRALSPLRQLVGHLQQHDSAPKAKDADAVEPEAALPQRPSAVPAASSTASVETLVSPASAMAAKSKTMTLAMGASAVQLQQRSTADEIRSVFPTSSRASEQYWVARALTAETLLAAKAEHQYELKEAYVKHTQDLDVLRAQFNARNRQLELLLVISFTTIAVLVASLLYLLWAPPRAAKPAAAPWLGSRVIIHVLSPFASVVENETSHGFGNRVIFGTAAIGACLLYFVWRHWYARGQRTG